ncbi:MAG TPA: ATP-binding protein [Pyrinomonadaceae bacterium]|jgi:two-component system NtrC family sensor kinase|nr:ATP-binding protein [Pyrinomonadaceae bacterium]
MSEGEDRFEDVRARAAGAFEFGRAAQADGAATLSTVVATVRRILRSDTASIARFSIEDRTVTWLATSGFHNAAATGETTNPLRGEFAERIAAFEEENFIEVRNVAGDLPASEFPLHSAEGLRDLGFVRLRARGESLGVLAVGYRDHHRFTAEERLQLEGLAEMAALALDNARLLDTLGAAKRVWEQTFDAIPDGIIVHDDRMRVVRCNMAAADALGLHPSEAAGMSCAEAFARLFGERAAAYHMRPGTARTTNSFELQAEDGRRYLVSVAPVSGLDAGAEGQWSVITWSDITTLAEVQEQLARTRRLATIGQLAAGVAHEINNPLAAITTCAEATLRDMRGSEESAALAVGRQWDYYLEEIVRQALRCKKITRGLLDLSRQKRARRDPVDLNRVVSQAAQIFEQRGRERGVKFEVEPDASVGEVATDEAMLRQVLDNLLSNALDAVADGGRVRVSTALDGARVRVEVGDDGHGIAPEVLARVFDPFFTTKDPGRGSGLGLAISLTLAEALGGAITVESRPDKGSLFRLWLPRRTPEQQ